MESFKKSTMRKPSISAASSRKPRTRKSTSPPTTPPLLASLPTILETSTATTTKSSRPPPPARRAGGGGGVNKRSEASRLKSYTNRIMAAPVFQNDAPSPRKMRAAKRNQVRGLPMIKKRDSNYEQAMKERLDLLGLVARKKKARKPAKGQKEKNVAATPLDESAGAGET